MPYRGAASRVHRLRSSIALWAALLMAVPLATQAQRVVAGTVQDSLGRPIGEARVSVALPTDSAAQSTLTDAQGRFTLRLPAVVGGAPLVLSVSRLGYVRSASVLEGMDGGRDTVRRAIRLLAAQSAAVQLAPVETRAIRKPAQSHVNSPGEVRRANFARMLDRLPVTAGDLSQSAALAPGVIPLGDNAGVSISGQAGDRNHTVVDQSSFGSSTLPAEAVASAGVVLNAYDASLGQFSGGELTATTRSGTNVWGGALRGVAADGRLRYGSFSREGSDDRASSYQLSGGGGGALVRDRVFVYGAFGLQRRPGTRAALDPDDPRALRRLGLAPDTVRRFLDGILHLGYPTLDDRAGDGTTEHASALARLDVALGERHLATLRLDGRGSRARGAGAGPTAAPGTGSEFREGDGGILGVINSLGETLRHEGRMYLSVGEGAVHPGIRGPELRVLTYGVADGGTPALTAFRAGGVPAGVHPERRRFFEVADELGAARGSASHVWKVGVIANSEQVHTLPTSTGSYTYATLDALDRGSLDISQSNR